MSRAEERTLPPAPRLGRVLRTAAEDLYYHGVRLVVANLIWGFGALVTAFALSRSLLGLLGLLAMVPLTIGLMGMATTLVRERTVVMTDFVRGVRGRFWKLLGLGLAEFGLIGVAGFDLFLGIRVGGIVGLVLGVVAFYSILALWVVALTVWPIVLDPERRSEPMLSAVRLGALLALAHPVRVGLMAAVAAIIALVSMILAAAIISFAAAYIALVVAHFVLPSADRLEGRPTRLEG
ncbi:MAG: hypothetical protein M3406_12575 [Chloroflexota bacterium]|nr:hypothetical protein [Chloroflexota bacterium]